MLYKLQKLFIVIIKGFCYVKHRKHKVGKLYSSFRKLYAYAFNAVVGVPYSRRISKAQHNIPHGYRVLYNVARGAGNLGHD